MVEKFHEELKQVKKDVVKMGNLSKEMLQSSVKALKERDIELAKLVISKKDKLADLDDKIEEKTLMLITLYQPMAKDMREIGCVLKLITYLNRIGRYGKDIARITEDIAKKPHVKKLVSLPYMSELVCKMIDDSLEVFQNGDISKFDDFTEREDTVDEFRYSIFRECLSYMMEDPSVIKRCTDYIMVARYLERCADHACKMAEKIVYMFTGVRCEIDSREGTKKECFTDVSLDDADE